MGWAQTMNIKRPSIWTDYTLQMDVESGVNREHIRDVQNYTLKLEEIITAISTNPHINLGDLVYKVREEEGKGWDGPAVKTWSEAVNNIDKIKALLSKDTE